MRMNTILLLLAIFIVVWSISSSKSTLETGARSFVGEELHVKSQCSVVLNYCFLVLFKDRFQIGISSCSRSTWLTPVLDCDVGAK
jgi:hypothetical protein